MDVTAAVFREPGQPLTIETLQLAGPGPGEVLVKVVASGICHSDLHVVNGEWSSPAPLVLGHEGAGIVDAVGDGVTTVSPGDHVVLSWMPYCRRCHYCLAGRPNLCALVESTAYNSVMLDGTTRLSQAGEPVYSYLATASFANWAVVPETAAIRIRDDAPLDKVSLVGCAVATGIGAVANTARVRMGSSVLVVGCGGVGLSTISGAVIAGAGQVIAVDINDSNLERARTLGATHTLNSRTEDVLAALPGITGSAGVDYAFEAIGLPTTIELAYDALAPGGTAVVVGQVAEGKKITIDPFVMSDREKTLTGSNYGSCRPPVDFPKIVDLYMNDRLPLDSLIERTIDIGEINKAFDAMVRGETARSIIIHQH
ncbi:Zn-dependent alcohol dehydrogenase [Rhodococcus jostii]|uniref:S-(Hydroxymethyl)glutathione dehydrogenase / alcohol dehydrogenase n=1 Tax=Rhodococcus jostii TaxID=132919 RepID=A0A1H4IKG8_RHOJO|nr:Zn-dependent alcohol dehydrogenase [Rhodococcus jostii]SEB34581.1 S-(hydroxymethyl)glutathione dehydrogenase / alcohol dehydrogenase [Rhodococcus jostii]